MSSFWNARLRNARSRRSRSPVILYTRQHAHAWNGGFASSNDHSYAGSAPFGCMYHSRSNSSSWLFANSGSIEANEIMWNERSHAGYHGYSHLSGIEITSRL